MAAASKPQKRRQLEADATLHLPEVDLDVPLWRFAARLFVTQTCILAMQAAVRREEIQGNSCSSYCSAYLPLQHGALRCRLMGVPAGRPHLHVHPGGIEAGAQRHDLPRCAAALCRLHEVCYEAPQRCCPGVVACTVSARRRSALCNTQVFMRPNLIDP